MTTTGKRRERDELADSVIADFVGHIDGLDQLQFPVERVKACALGYGWWVGVARMCDAVRQLYRLGFSHEASPLIRTVLHHTGALIWLQREPDGVVAAVEFEHPSQTARLYDHAQRRGWDLSQLQQVPQKPTGTRPPGLAYLDNFEQLCSHIGIPNLYVPYKVESGFAHPSGISADVYFDMEGGRVVGRPNARGSSTELRATAQFLLMATDAFADLIGDKSLSKLVADAAVRLGFTNGASADGS